MNSFSIAIVVIAYNRLQPVKRLLKSLSKANYPSEFNPTLIISVDKGDNKELELYVNSYNWKNGKKKVILRNEKMGLKEHVLACGDLTNEFDSIIVLEDDLYVSPNFFIYAVEGIQYFRNDSKIAGISLYNIEMNQSSMLPFEPECNRYDNYFIQYAQSWGQVWTKEQWKEFRTWYEQNKLRDFKEEYIPWNIRLWGEKSWLRYYILYCIENNKYFVYPYLSLSTNFSESGEHNKRKNSSFQVSLDYSNIKTYKFISIDNEDAIIYDSFFERQFDSRIVIGNIPIKSICMDIYGKKDFFENKEYIISSRKMNFEVVNQYGLCIRPQELNIIENIEGEELTLYKINKELEVNVKTSGNLNYYYKVVSRKNAMKLFFEFLKSIF